MQAIREKCCKFDLYCKKINKELYTILKNIELICFIDSNKVDDYKKFLITNISQKEKYKKLCMYLKNYCFKKNNNIYNYSEFIKKYSNEKKYMNKIYITNNIVESIHGKINYYLPKHITNVFNFLNCINKIFLNDTIDNNTIIRHDYITKSLLLLIDKENLNNKMD